MRKLAIITAAAVSSAGLAVGVVPAGAATHRGSDESFCESLRDFGGDVGSDSTTAFDPEEAEAIADSLRSAAGHAPKKVKKAMRRVARVYDSIAEEEDFTAAFANERFIRDSITYSSYYLETCLSTTIPTPEP